MLPMEDTPSIVALHALSWRAGWILILLGFASGAAVGLRFHDEGFWGGYASFRRRLVRLGHVACVALGMLNVLFALSPWPRPGTPAAGFAAWALIAGGVGMPLVCFLTGWRRAFRHLFAIPVVALAAGVLAILIGASQ